MLIEFSGDFLTFRALAVVVAAAATDVFVVRT